MAALTLVVAVVAELAALVPAAAGAAALPVTAYVTNVNDGTVTPIAVVTNIPGGPIPVGSGPFGVAVTPDGVTAYVTNQSGNSVTPITVATNTPGAPILVGSQPVGVAITPDGKTAYVTNEVSNSVTPIESITNREIYGTRPSRRAASAVGPAVVGR